MLRHMRPIHISSRGQVLDTPARNEDGASPNNSNSLDESLDDPQWIRVAVSTFTDFLIKHKCRDSDECGTQGNEGMRTNPGSKPPNLAIDPKHNAAKTRNCQTQR